MGKFRIDIGHWAQLSRLLDTALDQPADERLRWIETLGPDLDALKPELRRLLENVAIIETDDFLGTVPSLTLGTAGGVTPCIHAGDVVGPYRLLRELGTGGMGDVWLAERSDGLIQRPVALKLPHLAWRRAGLMQRLAREREILASLTHPNIARLYDVGVAADGQPFLALEYVDGERIDVYCRNRAAGIDERLRLVVQVSRAVAYAHSRLVVHRDLKPANILVSADGQVHLLDFGIARLLTAGDSGEPLTELAGPALTPDYASPEQIRGEVIGAASDVYSLGVLTFELLAGERPYRLNRSSRAALEHAILEADPRRPSDVAPAQCRRQLRGDIDIIVLKALKKDAAGRYLNADAFADDIERHLQSRPVLARPDSTRYRVGRFLRRNRLPMSAGAVAVIALVAGTGIAVWQARVARAEQRRTQEANEFIADVFRQADPNGATGRVYSAADLLRQAERRLQDDPNPDRRLQVELLVTIGNSQFGLQEHGDALRVFQRALDGATRHGIDDPQLLARIQLGLSQNLEYVGRMQDARLAVERCVALLQEAGLTHSKLFAQAKVQQSALYIGIGDDMAAAERTAREAIAAAESATEPSVPELATALQRLSHIYTRTQRRRESVEPARRSYELLEALYAGNAAHPQLLEATAYYAQALQSSGEFERSSEFYTQGFERAVKVFGADSRIVGELLSARSSAELDRGNVDQAVDDATRALRIYLQQANSGSIDHADRVRKLGTALIAARRVPEAVERLDEAVRLATAANAGIQLTHARLNLGLALAQTGRFAEADVELRNVLKGAAPNATRARHLAQRNLGTSLRLQGRPAEAIEYFELALAGASVEASHRGDLAQGLVEAALAHLALDDPDAARDPLERAERLFVDVQRERMSPARADLLLAQGRLHLAQGDVAGAIERLERAHRYWHERDPGSRWAGEADAWLAVCYRRAGRGEEAEAHRLRAQSVSGHSPPLNSAAVPL